jgi:hypothetical protein
MHAMKMLRERFLTDVPNLDLLSVPGPGRGKGKAEAIRRSCRIVWRDTYSSQACGFYERLGYAVFGTIEDRLPVQ